MTKQEYIEWLEQSINDYDRARRSAAKMKHREQVVIFQQRINGQREALEQARKLDE